MFLNVFHVYLIPFEAEWIIPEPLFLSFGRKRNAGREKSAKKTETMSHVRLKRLLFIKGSAMSKDRIEPAYPIANPHAETLP